MKKNILVVLVVLSSVLASAQCTVTISANGPTTICPGGNITLNATASTGVTYQWQLNGANIPGATASSYLATTSGQYNCTVSITGCNSVSNSIPVSVLGSNTVVIQPNGSFGQDAIVESYPSSVNTNLGNYTSNYAVAWASGSSYIDRTFIRFDLSFIPVNAVLQQATLTLFNNPSGINNGSHSSLNYSNASWLQRVTSSWSENTITWNNQPTTNTTNRVVVPPSTSAHQDFNIDVTTLTQGMVSNPGSNYGWMLRLQNEIAYCALVFASSDYADPTKWPKLSISYTTIDALITAAGSTSFCPGGYVTLNALSTGAGYSYQWKLNGADITGATTSSYPANVTGIYTCSISNGCGSITSNQITVTVLASAPTASNSASGATNICQGTSVVLSANTGTGLSYQWKLNGTNISGATSSSYSAYSAGTFTCLVSNGCGSTDSNPIIVTIISLAPAATIIANGPTSFCNGGSVLLNANTGTGLSYQWKRYGSDISGATSSSYSVSATGSYTCLISNGCLSANSNSISVTVYTFLPGSTITALGSTTICYDGLVSLRANIGATLSYQWQLNGSNISGATTAAYIATMAGNYTCVETNCNGSEVSNTITVIVVSVSVAITANGSTTFCSGGNITLNAAASPGVTYLWRKNGINISGATTSAYVASTSGEYSCIVSSTICSSISNSILVSVFGSNTVVIQPNGSVGQDAMIENYPSSLNSNFGNYPDLNVVGWSDVGLYIDRVLIRFDLSSIPSNAVIQQASLTLFNNPTGFINGTHESPNNSNASWLECVTSPWSENSVTWNNQPSTDTLNRTTISQSTSPHQDYNLDVTTYTQALISNPGLNYGWMIRLQTERSYCALVFASSENSNPSKWPKITITYSTIIDSSITAVGSTAICTGENVTLNALSTGVCYSYQWKMNGIDISGATSSSFTANVVGIYTCLVSNGSGSATSNPIAVTNNSLPTPTITAAGSTNICNGGSIVLSANTVTGLTYQWMQNQNIIPGETSSTYSATSPADYSCKIKNSCDSGVSNTIVVSIINSPIAIITASGSTSICNGGSVILNANTGTGLSYQWKNNGGPISGATLASYTATQAGNYTCVVTNSCSNTTSNAIAVTINTAPISAITAAGPTTFCPGGSVVLNANTGAGVTFQWKKNNANISGATLSSYTATAAGAYTCLKTNTCGNSTSNSISVALNSVPGTPASIAVSGGIAAVCPGDARTYTTPLVTGATSYNWVAPTGATITNGAGTNIISVAFNAGFVTSSTLSVRAVNSCGTSGPRNLTINRNLPATPGSITVTGGTAAVCPGDSRTFSIVAVTGALTYTWTAPTGATISSGQGTRTVVIAFNSGFTASGTLQVTANNNCGSSAARTLSITRNLPATPGAITGPTSVCAGTLATYSVNAVASALTYSWTVPAGAAIQGASNGRTISLLWGSTAGSVTIRSVNNCSTSGARSLTVNITCRETATTVSEPINNFNALLYPNPSRDFFTIQISSGINTNWTMIVHDITGRIIDKRENLSVDQKVEFGYDFSEGVYFAEVIQGQTRQVLKLVKNQ